MRKTSKTVLVTGDVQLDCFLVSAPTAVKKKGERSPAWSAGRGARLATVPGGAYLLADLVKAATGAQIVAPAVPGETRNIELLRSYATLELSDSEVNSDPVYRVNTFQGYAGLSGGLEPVYKDSLGSSSDTLSLIVIDDAGNGFTGKQRLWPRAVSSGGGGIPIVFNATGRAVDSGLWKKLVSKHAENLVVILDAEDLREMGAKISREVSWERTAADAAWQLLWSPSLKSLRACRNLVVRFGSDGALHARNRESGREFDLVYDPTRVEGEFSRSLSGTIPGCEKAFCAALADAVRTEGVEGVSNGISEGLSRARTFDQLGFGADPNTVQYPCTETFLSGRGQTGSFARVTVPLPTESSSPRSRSWSIAADSVGASISKQARDIVVRGSAASLKGAPTGRFGALKTVDRAEIESLRSVRNLMLEYLQTPAPPRPLSIAVFGTPGSGKSFGVTQVAKSLAPGTISKEGLEFNVSQFQEPADLARALHKVRDVSLGGKIPLVFFDEFDSSFGGSPLGWLKFFLMPMQDGLFREGETEHPIGKCIFIFAGGTSSTFEDFSQSRDADPDTVARFRDAKGPDFVSRLRGFVNVAGPNPVDDKDSLFRIRRALLLRSLLERKAKHLVGSRGRIEIEDHLVDALIGIPKYKHGARSMEALIDMSTIAGKERFDQSCLPLGQQLELHVDADLFLELLHLGPAIEEIAKAIHSQYRRNQRKNKPKDDPSMRPWQGLAENLRESNRQQAAHIPAKLKHLGYGFSPKSGTPTVTEFTDEQVEILAEMEHDRWMDERIQAGWRLGKRNPDRKTSPYLVSWEDLEGLEKNPQEWDRHAVRDIPRVLDDAGFQIIALEGN